MEDKCAIIPNTRARHMFQLILLTEEDYCIIRTKKSGLVGLAEETRQRKDASMRLLVKHRNIAWRQTVDPFTAVAAFLPGVQFDATIITKYVPTGQRRPSSCVFIANDTSLHTPKLILRPLELCLRISQSHPGVLKLFPQVIELSLSDSAILIEALLLQSHVAFVSSFHLIR